MKMVFKMFIEGFRSIKFNVGDQNRVSARRLAKKAAKVDEVELKQTRDSVNPALVLASTFLIFCVLWN